MQRWIWLLVSFATPCYAATLTGTITDENGLAVYKARILVFHDLSLVLSQRKITDFNGLYHFDLDPGPYRMFVLREGFQPVFAAVLILHEAEQDKIDIQLTPKGALASNREDPKATREETRTNRIKEVFRGSNLEPMHSESLLALAQASPSPREPQPLAGQLRSGSRRDLTGELEQTRSLEVQTRLADGISLKSTMVTEQDALGGDATHYGAAMDLDLAQVDLKIAAESRRHKDNSDVTSDAAHISGTYGETATLTTSVDLSAHRRALCDQRYASLSQEISYTWGEQRFAQELNAGQWRDEQDAFANRAHLGTHWQHAGHDWIALSASVDRLEAGNYLATYGETWVQLQKIDGTQRSFSAEFGLQDHPAGSVLVQKHHFGTMLGPIAIDTRYTDERKYLSLTGADIFGDYLPSTEPALVHEGFVAVHSQTMGVALSYDPEATYKASLQWTRNREEGQLLHSQRSNFFREQANHFENTFALAIQSHDDTAGLSYTYSENRSSRTRFELQSLSYRQMFSPFRNKNVGLQVEFTLKDNPDVPAWWLLEQLPWLEGTGNWYEGHLALQF